MSSNNPYPSTGNLAKGDQRPRESGDATATSGPRENLSAEEVDSIQIVAMKIGLAIKRGNRPAVYELVENALAAMRPQIESPMLSLSLAEVGIDVRTCNTLEARGILTVKDLLHADRRDLLAIQNFGEVSMIGIFAQLTSFSINRVHEVEQQLLGKCG